jgi:hypothetical protein
MRIAAWSGPRNLSTAMMYAFGARADCAVTDEPFYAAYLAATGLAHPMREAVLSSQPADAGAVAATLAGPVPGDRPHWYQKHMAGHMLPAFPLDWAEGCVHLHLIRHPARVVASYAAKRERPTLDDIAFVRQAELFGRLGGVVLDSADIRAQPRAMLETLCDRIGLPFDPAMLRWPAGGHAADGVWGDHWYDAVRRSTGFAPPEGALPEPEGADAALVRAALPAYEALAARALKPR